MKKIIYLLFLILFLLTNKIQASPGDTTWVQVHDHVDMTWYGNYDQLGIFPTGTTSYNKILMYWTLGCASTGCSDWDYDVHIKAGKDLGYNDSTIASIDTLTGDTTWNVFPAREYFEMARVITPYGGYMADGINGFSNAWEHVHIFDVTDFAPLLRNTVNIRSFYSGWSSGFDVTLRFAFIEGTPAREVLDIKNIYSGYYDYTTTAAFESTKLPAISHTPLTTANSYKLRVTPTGHGFDNSVNAAEFLPRSYYIKVNGTTYYTQNFWNDKCGLNPVFPQGGTWLYDRANWCPGSRAITFEHELTPYMTPGTATTIDMDIQSYTWSGTQTPGYSIDAILVSYGVKNYTRDVELVEIISPSLTDDYSRINPICGEPHIRIKNNSTTPLTYCNIEYGVVGGTPCHYQWTGNLTYDMNEEVALPIFNWTGVDASNPQFYVQLEDFNGMSDEFLYNNEITTTFTLADAIDSSFVVWLLTNNMPGENAWTIYDENDNIIHEKSGFAPNTQYKDTLTLAKGCYTFVLIDYDKDGLNWWANSDETNGWVRFRKTLSTTIIKNFQPDFGTEIRYHFTINSEGGNRDTICNATTIVEPSLIANQINIYPNPSRGIVYAEWNTNSHDQGTVTISNTLGQIVKSYKLASINQWSQSFDLHDLPRGIYIMTFANTHTSISKRIVLQH